MSLLTKKEIEEIESNNPFDFKDSDVSEINLISESMFFYMLSEQIF